MKANEEATFRSSCGSRFAPTSPRLTPVGRAARPTCEPRPRFVPRLSRLDRRRLQEARRRIAVATPTAREDGQGDMNGHGNVPETGRPTAFFYVITLVISVPVVDFLVRLWGS